MASAQIGALRVKLSMDAGEFSRGMKDAESKLGAFARNVGTIAAGIKLERALTSAIDSFVHNIKRAFVEADKLGKMAQSIGIPVEELSKLKHAADLSGVSLESLGKGVGRLSRNLVEAAQGSGGPARAFETLGISIRNADGSLKTMSQVLPEIADRFSKMRDGPEKTALSMQLLGRAGADMIPLLNGGAAGLREMMKEAEKLGLVIDSKTAKAAEDFNDNLTRLGRVKDGLIIKITAELAPALRLLSERFLEVAKESDVTKVSANAVTKIVEFLAFEVADLSIGLGGLASQFSALWKAAVSPDWAGMKAGFQEYWKIADQTKERLDFLPLYFENFKRVAAFEADLAAKMAATGGGKLPISDRVNEVKNAMALAADEARRWKDEMRAAFDDVLSQDTTPVVDKIKAINKAMQEGIITQREWGKLTRDVQKDNVKHMTDLASATASALTTIFKDNKLAAIASAIINTAVGVTKALSAYPPPISFAMAGLQAAAGAAQIAAIKSTNEKGGGSVPSVSSSGAATAAASTPGPAGGTLTVQGINPGSLFSGDAMRSLAEQLLQYQRDGGRVVFA